MLNSVAPLFLSRLDQLEVHPADYEIRYPTTTLPPRSSPCHVLDLTQAPEAP